jgi:uncharacterized protein
LNQQKTPVRFRRIAITILVVSAVITALAAWRVSYLGMDYNFEAFFPKDDPDKVFFYEHRERYGTDNDFILIGLKSKTGIFDPIFLQKVEALTDTLQYIPDIKKIVSPTRIQERVRDPLIGTTIEIPYLRWDQPANYPKDSLRIFRSPELVGSLFSKDGKSLCIVIYHEELIRNERCDPLSEKVLEITRHYGFDEHHIAGRCVGESFYVHVIKGEMYLFLAVAFLLLIIVMFLIYRTLWGVALPILVVGVDVLWTLGLMEATGKSLDVISNVIPVILMVIGLSVAVHLLTKFLDKLEIGYSRMDAIKFAIRQVGLASVFTTLTTMVGFASLAELSPLTILGSTAQLGWPSRFWCRTPSCRQY